MDGGGGGGRTHHRDRPGQLIDFRTGGTLPNPVPQRQIARATVPTVETSGNVQPITNDNDEAFIEPELTSSQVGVPESLQYLNAITPGARDLDPR